MLGYSPLTVGLSTMIYAMLSIVFSTLAGRWVSRAGARTLGVWGLVLMGAACALFTRIVPQGEYLMHLLPGLILFGPGIGIAAVSSSVAALSDVKESEAGLASGLNSAMFQIGGAVGVAVTATVVAAYSGGASTPAQLNAGYVAGFWACVIMAVACLPAVLLLFSNRKLTGPAPAHVAA